MQTFMPYSDFEKVAQCLDNKRLGKQRVEALQIYNVLKKIYAKERGELPYYINAEIEKNEGCTNCPYLKQCIDEAGYTLMDEWGKCPDEINDDVKIAWEHHPIVKMWKGHDYAILQYGLAMCSEWVKRGFKDTLARKFCREVAGDGCFEEEDSKTNNKIKDEYVKYPSWIFDKELQLSHQSNLVRKLPEHYRKYFPNVPDNLEYKWVR